MTIPMTDPVAIHELYALGSLGPERQHCPECGRWLGLGSKTPIVEHVDALGAVSAGSGAVFVSDYSKVLWEKLQLKGAAFLPAGDGWGMQKWRAKRWQMFPSTYVDDADQFRDLPCSSCHMRTAADMKDVSTWKPNAKMVGDLALGIGAHEGHIACSQTLQDALERFCWYLSRGDSELGKFYPVLGQGPVTRENWSVLIELVRHLGNLSELHPGSPVDEAVIPTADDHLYSSVLTTDDLNLLIQTLERRYFSHGWIWFPRWDKQLQISDDIVVRPGHGGFLEWSADWRVNYEEQSVFSSVDCPRCGGEDRIPDILERDLRCEDCGHQWDVTEMQSYDTVHYDFGNHTLHPKIGSMKAPVVYRFRVGTLNPEIAFVQRCTGDATLLSYLFRMSQPKVTLISVAQMWV